MYNLVHLVRSASSCKLTNNCSNARSIMWAMQTVLRLNLRTPLIFVVHILYMLPTWYKNEYGLKTVPKIWVVVSLY